MCNIIDEWEMTEYDWVIPNIHAHAPAIAIRPHVKAEACFEDEAAAANNFKYEAAT